MKRKILSFIILSIFVISCISNVNFVKASSYVTGGNTIDTAYDLSAGLTSASIPTDNDILTKDISYFEYTATESGTHKFSVTWTSANQRGLYVKFLDNDGNAFNVYDERLNSGLGATATIEVSMTKGAKTYILISPEYENNETANIRVTQPESSKIALNKTTVKLSSKKTFTLKLNNNKAKVIWVSSDKSIAEVSSKGKIIAKKAGKAKVYAIANDKLYICKVTVTNK